MCSDKRKKNVALKPEQLSADVQRLFEVLNEESDLPCVLIGISFLDETVRSILSRSLLAGSTSERLLSPLGGAIGEFSTRCDLGYCLRLIKKDYYSDLRKLAEIRNVFAHNYLGTDFGDSEIQGKCRELLTPDLLKTVAPKLGRRLEELNEDERKVDARNRFTASVAMLSNFLLTDALSIGTKADENGT